MKAILYAAKSTADVRGSIPTQLADCRELAEAEDLDVAGEFSDEAASAFSGDRGPELAHARALAETLAGEHGECAFVIQHSDRLARGDGVQATHLVEYALWAIKAGVKLRSIQDPQTFADLLYAVVTGQRNHEDSRRKGLAVKAGMARRAERGKHSGPRPFGYAHDQERGLAIIDHEAEIVRRIYTEFVAGRSLSAIARDLHGEGVATAHGGTWRQSTVSGILQNPTYLGKIRHHGEVLDGQHESIIDAELVERAGGLLAARSSRGRGRPPKGRHLFRGGMLRCGHCGEAMVPRTTGGYELYYCNGRSKLGTDFCEQKSLRRVDVDDAVYRYFEQVGLDLEATRTALAESRDRKLIEIRTLRDEAEQELRRAEERLARVRRDYTDGKLSAADWSEFRDELTADCDGARAELDRLVAQANEVEAWGEFKDAEAETYRRLAEIRTAIKGAGPGESIDAVRAVLSRMFEGFVIRRPERIHVELLGSEFVIDPVPREQSIAGYSESLTPQLRREPLQQAENKQHVGSPWR